MAFFFYLAYKPLHSMQFLSTFALIYARYLHVCAHDLSVTNLCIDKKTWQSMPMKETEAEGRSRSEVKKIQYVFRSK